MKNALKAFLYGVKDGWRQPYDLGCSRNVDHLYVEGHNVYNWLDAGINTGQFLRAGTGSEAYRLRYWPFRITTKKEN